jgi:hypothetical protein
MNRREAEELLPWFVAGSLSEEETRAVQAFIDSGEIEASELESLEIFAQSVAQPGAEEPEYDSTILQRAMQQLDGIEQEQPQLPLVVSEADQADDGEQPVGLVQRLLDKLQWSVTPPLARIVVAGQFALLLGLVTVVALREPGPVDVISHTVAGSVVGQSADFTLSFTPDASEASIRALLLDNRLHIVAGPSALGLYQVAAAEDADLERVSNVLAGSSLVVLVQPVPRS